MSVEKSRKSAVATVGLGVMLILGLGQPVSAQQAFPNQVLIEMMIFEIKYENFRDLGMHYEWTREQGRIGNSVLDLPTLLGTEINNLVGVPGEGVGEIVFRAINSKYGELHATLKALIKAQKARLLSQPRILTQEGYEATIRTSERIPYLVKNSTSGGFTYAYQEEQAGLIVKVTPMDYSVEDGFITLKLNPVVNVYTHDITIENLKMPVIEERAANVTLRIPSGSTFAIGGLFQDIESEAYEGVPILSDIPLLGLMFRNHHTKKLRSELVIFVTPVMIGMDDSYSSAVGQPSRFGDWRDTTPMPETP